MVTQDDVKEALKAVKYPGYSRDIVSFGLVKDIRIDGDAVGRSPGDRLDDLATRPGGQRDAR